jgi:hypothetical protein
MVYLSPSIVHNLTLVVKMTLNMVIAKFCKVQNNEILHRLFGHQV